MTFVNFLLILCAVIAIAWGAYTLWISLTKTNKTTTTPLLEHSEKDGIPIIPRHERPEYQTNNQNPNNETTATPAEATSTTEDNSTNVQPLNENPQTNQTIQQQPSIQPQQAGSVPDTVSEYFVFKSDEQSANSAENLAETPAPTDAFSTLANATETITPTVQTFDERKLKKEGFSETSPILDNHIQSQLDNDQNSPLNNAVQNLNISLFPNEMHSRIAGRDLLHLFDKYGLKYGTMNMFHRYDNKDGTGLLWFSVMMINDDGIVPFDLNKLPNQYVKGLVMFVALPHPEARRGFDSMISISGLLAQDLQASLYDEAGDPLTKESIQQMRELAIDFAK